MPNVVRVHGLAAVRRDLRKLEDVEASKELQRGLKRAAEVVAVETRSRMPQVSGRAKGAVKSGTSGARAFVRLDKAVPYVGWLVFGSRNPKQGQPRRVGPWAHSGAGPKSGRWLYPAIDDKSAEVTAIVDEAFSEAATKAGW